jgi:hypothetical protein
MRRHDVLERLHSILQPRGYLEIGVDDGRSLALSRSPSVAIDPVNRMKVPITCDLRFVQATSDDFFADPSALDHLPGRAVDLAFIDGMHLFEYVLRDFINVERVSHPGTVIVLDDMLPRNRTEALRNRRSKAWTGDVYKLLLVLREYRPDLVLTPLDTAPTGVALVLGADRGNRVLSNAYDRIIDTWVTEDPQDVPQELLDRTTAWDPEEVLAAPFWDEVVRLRTSRPWARRAAAARLRHRVHASLGGAATSGTPGGATAAARARTGVDALRSALKPRTRLRRLVRRVRRGRAAGDTARSS